MDFKCKCGNIVVKGEIKFIEKKGRRKKKLLLDGKPKGIISRNNSKNPKDWKFTCSSCQSKETNP